MAAWFIPALKAVLPHIGTIVSAAVPVFTRKSAETATNQALLQQQITELQSAASQNALNIKDLAAQLQSTLAALEQAAVIAQARYRRVFLAGIVAVVLSVTSLGTVLYRLFAPL